MGAIGIEKTRDAKVYIEYILSFKTTTKNKLIYKSVHLFMCLNAYWKDENGHNKQVFFFFFKLFSYLVGDRTAINREADGGGADEKKEVPALDFSYSLCNA